MQIKPFLQELPRQLRSPPAELGAAGEQCRDPRTVSFGGTAAACSSRVMVLAAGKCHCFSTESFPANGVTLNSQGSRKQCRNSARARALPKDCSSFVLKFYCGHQTQPMFYSQFSLSLGIKVKVKESYKACYKDCSFLSPALK